MYELAPENLRSAAMGRGGWVGYRKVEENEAVRTRGWSLMCWVGGWVGGWGGWVGGFLPDEDEGEDVVAAHLETQLAFGPELPAFAGGWLGRGCCCLLCVWGWGLGGWLGGWLGCGWMDLPISRLLLVGWHLRPCCWLLCLSSLPVVVARVCRRVGGCGVVWVKTQKPITHFFHQINESAMLAPPPLPTPHTHALHAHSPYAASRMFGRGRNKDKEGKGKNAEDELLKVRWGWVGGWVGGWGKECLRQVDECSRFAGGTRRERGRESWL